VLTDKEAFPDKWNPSGFTYLVPRSLLGLPTNEEWTVHRKLLSPLFAERFMRTYCSLISDHAKILVGKWSGTELDIRDDLVAFGGDVIGFTGFGVQFDTLTTDTNRKYLLASRDILADVSGRLVQPWFVSYFQFERKRKAFAAFNDFQDLVDGVLKAQDKEATNMVAVMANAGLSREEIRDETIGLLLAGHETTSNTMAWLFLMLARNPEHIELIRKEVDSVMGSRTYPEYNDLPKFVYTKQCVNETLRLYTTLWRIARTCAKDTHIGDHPVLKGQRILISLYSMSHSSKVFKDPHDFKPERFSSEDSDNSAVQLYSFLPFGGSTRVCIGRTFAMQEILIVIASVCKNLNIVLSPKTPSQVLEENCVSLAPISPIVLQFTPR